MKLLTHSKTTDQLQSGASKIIIIIIIIIVTISLAWIGQRAVANMVSEQNYKDAKKLLLDKKPKEAYSKLLDAKSYALKKDGPEYYIRLAGIALTNGDKEAAKQHVSDGLKALENYTKKDKDKLNQQLKRMQKAIEGDQPSPDRKVPPLDFKNLKNRSNT